MTLLETERLVRKLSALLKEGGNPDVAPTLAGDYAEVCHAANLRLQQCEAMIKAGDRHQAIQLAETAPNLLQLITILEFRGADEWRASCQQNAFPVADRIDGRAVQALNACYAQGIATDHPLYAGYRRAVLTRNDEEALQVLQSITRLNPSDDNAASELARVDAKVLGARLEGLGNVLVGGDPPLVVAAIETMEAFGFKTRIEGETWVRAQAVRCGVVADELEKLKAASRWEDAIRKIDFVRRLQADHRLDLHAGLLKKIEAVETWAKGEQEKDRKDYEFRALLTQLYFRVNQSEEKDTSARLVLLPELRDDFEALNKVWRSLTDFTRPIPEHATSAFRKRASLLEAEIARRTAIRRRGVVAVSAAGLLVGGVIVWFVLGQMKAREFASELTTAVSQRQVRAAERLLDRVRSNEKRLLSVGRVNAAVAEAESLVTKERGLLAGYEAAQAKLPAQLGGEPEVARLNAIADSLAQARTALNALAPDLKAENAPHLQAFEREWRRFLSESGVAVNGLLEQWIGQAEKQTALLDYRAPVAQATVQLSSLSNLVQRYTELEAGFTNSLSLRSDLLQRGATARAKFRAYDVEFKKLSGGMAMLQEARTFKGFAAAVSLMASSEFSGSPAASAAVAVQALGVSDEAMLRSLLNVTNAGTWAFLKKDKPVSLVPEIAMPAEQTFFQQLNNDPAVAGSHYRYRLWLDPEGRKTLEWITAGSFDASERWQKIKAWAPSASATSATFNDREYGRFGGQWKLASTERIHRLERLGKLEEASAFGTVGLGAVWSGGSTYARPLMEVLDAVKDSHDGSPIFRAWLFLRLIELMEFQPEAWGLSFCPSAGVHAAQIRAIVGGRIASGDWFVPEKAKTWSEKLDLAFAAMKPVSYAKQAVGIRSLSQSAAKDGLRYVGFAGLVGKPVLVGTPPPAEIWGYEAARRQPALVSTSAMPLSPLFALLAPHAEYLSKAGIQSGDPSFTDALPPLFRSAPKP